MRYQRYDIGCAASFTGMEAFANAGADDSAHATIGRIGYRPLLAPHIVAVNANSGLDSVETTRYPPLSACTTAMP